MNMFIYLMVLDTEEEKIKFVKIYDAYKVGKSELDFY